MSADGSTSDGSTSDRSPAAGGVDGPAVPTPAGAGGAVPARGPDLVRQALAEAKAAARAKGVTPGGGPRKALRKDVPRRNGDGRDPLRFGDAIQRLVNERGWEDTTTAAGVLANWGLVVGPEIADHCQPSSLIDGELVLVAESTAWATQLRLLTKTLVARVRDHAGEGVVTKVVVRGPAQPDWRKGPRRVQGRGPRDTYG